MVRPSPVNSRPAITFRSLAKNHTAIIILILLNLLCFQVGRNYEASSAAAPISLLSQIEPPSSSRQQSSSSLSDPLRPPPGEAKALPRIATADDAKDKRAIYGGKGDGQHLGGWTEIDIQGISPRLWRHMMTSFGIRSIIDVGCGRGISTSWFLINGMDALCVEGSHDAYVNSVLPDKDRQMVEHDFSRGPYWPAKTYDAVWSVEFLEHVGRNFHKNYLPVFRKAAILFVTHSIFGGWHHVEVHKDEWWIRKYEMYGFRYMPELTMEVRETARQEAFEKNLTITGEKKNPQNLYTMLVFFNPAVGSLPEHAHLFAEPGCYKVTRDNGKGNFRCGDPGGRPEETSLPPEFEPLPVLYENQLKWEEHIKKHINLHKQ